MNDLNEQTPTKMSVGYAIDQLMKQIQNDCSETQHDPVEAAWLWSQIMDERAMALDSTILVEISVRQANETLRNTVRENLLESFDDFDYVERVWNAVNPRTRAEVLRNDDGECTAILIHHC